MKPVTEISDSQRSREMDELYWRDGYTWAMQQAEALRRRDLANIDWKNVTEEIEDMGRHEVRRLKSQYARAIEHLLKLQYREPGETEPVAGWRRSVNQARVEIEEVLQDNPGLKGERDEVFARAWPGARKTVVNAFVHYATQGVKDDSVHLGEQKRLTREWSQTLPQENPYTREQVEDSFWLPERTLPSAKVGG